MNQPIDIMPKPYDAPHAKESYPYDGWAIEIAAWAVIAVILIGTLTIAYLVAKELTQ